MYSLEGRECMESPPGIDDTGLLIETALFLSA